MTVKTSMKHFDKWLDLMPEDVEPYLIPIKEGKSSDEGKAPDYLEITKRGLRKYGLGWKEYRKLKSEYGVVKIKHLAELAGEGDQVESDLRVSSWQSPYAKLSVEESRQRVARGKNLAVVTRGMIAVMDVDDPGRAKKILPEELADTLTVETRTGKSHLYFRNGGVDNCDVSGVVELRAKWRYVLTPGSYVPPEDSGGSGLYKVLQARELRTLTVDDLPPELRDGAAGKDKSVGSVLKDYSPAVLDNKVMAPCPFFERSPDDMSSIYLDLHRFAKSLILTRLQVMLEDVLAVGGDESGLTYKVRLMDGEIVLVDGENSTRLASVEVKTSKDSVSPVKAAALAMKKGIPSIIAEVQTGDVHVVDRGSATEMIERAKEQLGGLTKLKRADRKIPDRYTCKRCSNESCQYWRNSRAQRVGKPLVEEETKQLEKCPSPIVENVLKVVAEMLESEGYSVLKLGSALERSEKHEK